MDRLFYFKVTKLGKMGLKYNMARIKKSPLLREGARREVLGIASIYPFNSIGVWRKTCRRGIPHDYDIVEGPMADDQIWDYVEDFMEGAISREAFWELAKFKYPTHQITFCTGKALETLTFKEFKRYVVNTLGYDKLYRQLSLASVLVREEAPE